MSEIWKEVKKQFVSFMEVMSLMAGYFLATIYNLFVRIFGKDRRSTVFRLKYLSTETPIDKLYPSVLVIAFQRFICTIYLTVLATVGSILAVLHDLAVKIKDLVLSLFDSRKRKHYAAKRGGVVINVVINVIVASGIIVLGILGSILYAITSVISAIFNKR